MRALGRALKVAIAGIAVAALTLLSVPLAANAAAPSWVNPPTRLYMLPTNDVGTPQSDEAANPSQSVLEFDDAEDDISHQLRTLEIESVDGPNCFLDASNNFVNGDCTAIQFTVSHGTLDFGPTDQNLSQHTDPDFPGSIFWEIDGGAFLRDFHGDVTDPAQYPLPSTAIIGTTAQLNAALDLLRFIPDADYNTYDDGNATLNAVFVAGDDATAAIEHPEIDIELKVLDWNDAPSVIVPSQVIEVNADQEVDLGFDTDWDVNDPDNDEPDGDGHLDGPGDRFLLAAWSTCGVFEFLPGTVIDRDDDTYDLIAGHLGHVAPTPGSPEDDQILAIQNQLPLAVTSRDGTYEDESEDSLHSAYLAIVEDLELEYLLGNIDFHAEDAAGDPIDNVTCRVLTYVTDLGNNGLPAEYVGAPPTGLETPNLGIDELSTEGEGINAVTVKVGAGTELELNVLPVAPLTEGTSGVATITISPAEHPAFTLDVQTSTGLGAVGGVDYTAMFQNIGVPADAASVQVPVDALTDPDIDPGEYYNIELVQPLATAPAGYTLTSTTSSQQVLILDTNGIDVTSPTATIGQAATQLDPTSFSPVVFAVVFDEAVTGFDESDISFVGSTAAGALTATVTGSGESYQVAVQGMTTSGLVKISVADGAAEDASGNLSDAAVPTDNSVQYILPNPADTTRPTVTVNQGATQLDPTNVEPIVFDVVFSEPVVGFEPVDLFVGGTAATNIAQVIGSGTTYQVLISDITAPGTVTLSVADNAAQDAAGNLSEFSTWTDNEVNFVEPDPSDTTGPTVTIEQDAGQADPTSTSPIVFDVVFNEPVIGFENTDVTLGGTAGATTVNVIGFGQAYKVQVTGMSSAGTVTASIPANAVEDAAGNFNEASTSTDNEVTWQPPAPDVVAPTVTIDQGASQGDPTPFSPIVFDVLFSEPVTGFTGADVTLAGTALPTTAVVSGSGAVYEVAVSGMTVAGTVIASIGAGGANDLGGNANLASTSTDNSVTFDIVPPGDVTQPTVTIVQGAAQADPTSSSPIVFDVEFSEPVAGFTSTDVVLSGTAGATTAVVSGPGPIYTVSVAGMTTSGTVTAAIPAGAAADASGNLSMAALSADPTVTFDLVVDTTAPTVTVDQAPAQADPTGTSPVLFEVEFSEPVLGFTDSDVSLSGTAGATTAVISGTGPLYTVAVSGMTASGTVVVTINAGVAADGAGNLNEASTAVDNTVDFVLDATQPTVTVEQHAAQTDPTTATPIVYAVEFSEPVTGLTASDFSTTLSTVGGTLTLNVLGSGASYTVEVSGMTSAGDVVLQLSALSVVDGAGNGNLASTSTDNVVAWTPLVAPLAFDFVPSNITVVAGEGQSGANVTFATPTASGGVPPVTVSCDAASGDFFPIGTTTVTCTATDSAEIQLFAMVQASFDITVTAPPAPMPVTGAEAAPVVALGVMLLLGGGLVLLFARRRTA